MRKFWWVNKILFYTGYSTFFSLSFISLLSSAGFLVLSWKKEIKKFQCKNRPACRKIDFLWTQWRQKKKIPKIFEKNFRYFPVQNAKNGDFWPFLIIKSQCKRIPCCRGHQLQVIFCVFLVNLHLFFDLKFTGLFCENSDGLIKSCFIQVIQLFLFFYSSSTAPSRSLSWLCEKRRLRNSSVKIVRHVGKSIFFERNGVKKKNTENFWKKFQIFPGTKCEKWPFLAFFNYKITM